MSRHIRRNEFFKAGLPADESAVDLTIKAELGAAIAKYLQDRQVSQSEAARQFDVPQPVLSKICRGHLERLSVSYLWKLLFRMGQGVCAITGRHPDDTFVEVGDFASRLSDSTDDMDGAAKGTTASSSWVDEITMAIN